MNADRRNPLVAVDLIIEVDGKIVLIERKNPPLGWALPGGFVDYGESLEQAALREAKEETGLAVCLTEQFYTYSEPGRDPRHHTVTTVFLALARGCARAGDDAGQVGLFTRSQLPAPIVFDHHAILEDYFNHLDGRLKRRYGRQPAAEQPDSIRSHSTGDRSCTEHSTP